MTVERITLTELEQLEAARDLEQRAQLELDLAEALEKIEFLEALLADVLREGRAMRERLRELEA